MRDLRSSADQPHVAGKNKVDVLMLNEEEKKTKGNFQATTCNKIIKNISTDQYLVAAKNKFNVLVQNDEEMEIDGILQETSVKENITNQLFYQSTTKMFLN